MSLELGPRGLLVFEDYAKGTTGNGKKKRPGIPGMCQALGEIFLPTNNLTM